MRRPCAARCFLACFFCVVNFPVFRCKQIFIDPQHSWKRRMLPHASDTAPYRAWQEPYMARQARLSTAASSRPIWTKSMQHAMAQVIYWVVFHYLDLFTVHGVLAKRRFSSNERGQLLSQIYRISGYFSTFVERKRAIQINIAMC